MINIKMQRNYLDISVEAGMSLDGVNQGYGQNTIGFLSALEEFLSVLDGYDNVKVVIRNSEQEEQEKGYSEELDKSYSLGPGSFKYSVNFGGTMASQNFNIESEDTHLESDYREDLK